MKRKAILGFFLCAVMLLLTSCDKIQPDVESLLSPPKLTQEQREIYDALVSSAASSSIKLKYPKAGEYRSAFVMYDIDGDGEEEAIAFYDPQQEDPSVRISILDRQNGEWASIYDKANSSGGVDVDRVMFENISSTEHKDMIIGWNLMNRSEKGVGIYAYEEQKLVSLYPDENEHEEMDTYSEMVVADLNGDLRQEIILLKNSSSTLRSSVRLVGYRQGKVLTLIDQQLRDGIMGYSKVQQAAVEHGVELYADVYLGESMMGTEILRVTNSEITYLTEKTEVFAQTQRASNLPSRDVDNDGRIEVPVNTPLPGYSSEVEDQALYLTSYNRWEDGKPVAVLSAVVNHENGYMFTMPPEWIGKVTVVTTFVPNEWKFIRFNETLENDSDALLYINVYAEDEYKDKNTISQRTLIDTKGIFEYYLYVPESADPQLAIPLEQARELFALLV
ncbi:hypothetical protein [Zongyangia hominis]|uniref:VCBS repeat-containing protein n=1 Tax=Zongyangia hominis TaxID=2763677 RepID=A0A926IC22_9FIRM|nr:hypothetical protein [Zongyangia hominis]MBC8570888.1 hypothetical protein [Zongyangia hominis]